ncbi:MAG: T9SS type A sorting domain-containing protein [Bacteroidota bacterium]
MAGRIVLLCLLLFPFGKMGAQATLERADIVVYRNGDLLELAWSGGMNNPQFSEADLDNDGRTDLFVFDKSGYALSAFRRTGPVGSERFEFAPELIQHFPRITQWALLRDYNCDMVPDLFCYSVAPGIPGVTVFKGQYGADNLLQFEQLQFPEYTFPDIMWYPTQNGFQSNLFVRNIDIPAIDDVDGDGDMDILTFGVIDGYLEYYENQSMDLGFGCDTLIMRLVDDCWGRFAENSADATVLLSPEPDSCINRAAFIGKNYRHIGSTVLTLDTDNDQDKDLFLGDSGSPFINYLVNSRNQDTAFLTLQDPNFPSEDIGLQAWEFLASYAVDLNEDGLKDLLFAPNQLNTAQDVACSYRYDNVGTINNYDFSFTESQFLVGEMLDEGAFSQPHTFDVNQDGLPDLLIGYQRWEAQELVEGRIVYYENYGTPNEPKFRLADINWLDFNSLDRIYPYLSFADLDNDLDVDLVVGSQDGRLLYFENTTSGPGLVTFTGPTIDYQSIDVGQYSTPSIIDLNGDNLLDLVIGNRNGSIWYYENTGTINSPAFTLVNDFLGEMDTRAPGFPTGYAQAVFIEEMGQLYCYSGSDAGQIFKYLVDSDSLVEGAWPLESDMYDDLFEGGRSKIHWADLNNDQQAELIIGNRRGGLTVFSADPLMTTNIEAVESEDWSLEYWPNPGDGLLNLRFQGANGPINLDIVVWNSVGQGVRQINWQAGSKLDLKDLNAGVYFLEWQAETGASGRLKYVKVE